MGGGVVLPEDTGMGNDLNFLLRIIRFIRDFIEWVLKHESMIRDEQDRNMLAEEFYNRIVGEFERLINHLEELFRGDGETARRVLEPSGLLGSSLLMKGRLLQNDSKKRRWKRIFKRAISILGSLHVPGAELIKEFLEQLEQSVEKEVERDDEPPILSLDLN